MESTPLIGDNTHVSHTGSNVPSNNSTCSRKKTCLTQIFWGVIAAFTEIGSMIYAGAISCYNKRFKPFHHEGLNPKELSEKQAQNPAIVFLPGDNGDTTYLLPLMRKVHQAGLGTVFTVDPQYSDVNPEQHLKQLDAELEEIKKKFTAKAGAFRVVFIAHSKGASLAVNYALNMLKDQPEKQKEICGLVALSGRLKVVPAGCIRKCSLSIKPQIESAYKALEENPDFLLRCIAGGKDWLVPRKAALVGGNAKHNHVVEGRSHTSVVYSCSEKVIEFTAEILALQKNLTLTHK